jgi:hypothetical protein
MVHSTIPDDDQKAETCCKRLMYSILSHVVVDYETEFGLNDWIYCTYTLNS